MRKPDLGRSPLITQTFIVAEVELVDEGVDDPATVDFHHLQAKYQLHVLRGSPEDLMEVLPILPANDLQQRWALSGCISPEGTPPACWPSWSEDFCEGSEWQGLPGKHLHFPLLGPGHLHQILHRKAGSCALCPASGDQRALA